jgi:putative ABC transport system permease protein
MYAIALKMLIEDRAKFLGMVMSLSFSALIITQQAAIFIGVMRRTYATITDTPQADIWVMDRNIQFIDDISPLRSTELYRIRSIDGVAWAMPFYKGLIRARLSNGQFQTCNLIGIDDATLIGGPHTMLQGRIQDLRAPDAIIVNKVGADDKLAQNQGTNKPKRPLMIGEQLELNDSRATVVGICDVTRTFQSQPVIYTTYNRALKYAPYERKRLSFILVKAEKGVSVEDLCKKITKLTNFATYSKKGFEKLTINYYLTRTGIPINFGLAILLGLLVGAAVTGQIFYNFVTENLKYLGLFSLMGAQRELLAKMTLVQALWIAFLGWGIGSGSGALLGFLTRNTELSFYLPWQLFIATGIAMLSICMAVSLLCIRRIYNIELGILFKT